MSEIKESNWDGLVYRAALYLAFVSAFFSLLFISYLAANCMALRDSDPRNLLRLSEMRSELWKTPGNKELQENIRELDLVVRKAYYSGLVFSRTGAWLLLASIALFVFSLKYVLYVRAGQVPVPARRGAADGGGSWAWIYPAAAALLFFAFAWYIILKYYGKGWRPDFSALAAEKGGDRSQAGIRPPPPSRKPPPSDEEILGNWPQFRGPFGTCRSAAKNLPVKWDAGKGEGVLWKLELPLPGNNSPVLWQGSIYILGADKERKELWCIDAASGSFRWKTEIRIMCGSGLPPEVFEDTSFTPSTLATDGRALCAIFPDGFVAAFDMTGRQMWFKFFGSPENPYGHASSPVIVGDTVFVQFDHGKEDLLCAYDLFSGDEKWRQAREMDPSWATPFLLRGDGKAELVLNAPPRVVSYDPQTGAENWSAECSMNDLTISPAFSNGILVVPGKDSILQALKMPNRQLAWEISENVPEVASPLAAGSLLFTANVSGNMSCHAMDDGRTLWSQDFGTGFYSSPAEADGRVYVTDVAGVTHVVAAKGEFSELSQNPLAEPSFTIPAFADGRIFIRGQKNLFCIGAK